MVTEKEKKKKKRIETILYGEAKGKKVKDPWKKRNHRKSLIDAQQTKKSQWIARTCNFSTSTNVSLVART